ncbi:MAG TPA: transcription antitermination factor NusB [Candidatus Bathyarchaeia archaeon]|nr:transcription antitermination factor NusB [Candidatus Bathyarchaeia archaeon]
MKTSLDPRHIRREKAIKALFASSFHQEAKTKNKIANQVLGSAKKIDEITSKIASEWPIGQINKVDLAILRLAIYELLVARKEPAKVIIDEAVELGKKYGSQSTAGFVNGVLGTILNQMNKENHDQK